MKFEYDWSTVPEEIKWAVTDVLGRKLGFINKPDSPEKYCVMWCDYFIDSKTVVGVKGTEFSLQRRIK